MTLPILQEQPGLLGSFIQGANIGLQKSLPSISDLILLHKQKDPFKQQQQDRLTKDSISMRYNRAITEIDSALKNGVYRYGSDDYKNALQTRDSLVKARDQLLDFSDMMYQMPEQGEESNIPKPSSKKIKFDIANPQHKKARDQALKKTNGDQKKAAEILLKTFDL